MDFPAYKFSKQCQGDLKNFLKVAQEQSERNNPFCNMKEFDKWKQLLPKEYFALNLNLDEEPLITIDLSNDDHDISIDVDEFKPEDSILNNEGGDLSISEIRCAIAENFLSDHIKQRLCEFSKERLEVLFVALSNEPLGDENVIRFGTFISDFSSSVIISNYCKFLLIPKLLIASSENLLSLLGLFCKKHSDLVQNELLEKLQSSDLSLNVLLHNLVDLDPHFRAQLLKKFVGAIENVGKESYLNVVENLLNSQADSDTLNKLFELLSNSADQYSLNKTYGKLVVAVIQLLAPNLIHLEQTINYLIGNHQTLWRNKLQKIMDDCFQESQLFSPTQSFRY